MSIAGISGIALFIVALLYFTPTVIAILRHHHSLVAVIALNWLLGWTFIGWVAALVWSLSNGSHPVVVNVQQTVAQHDERQYHA
jgi:Superinfection immunity protein